MYAPRGACLFRLFISSPAVFSLFLCAPLGACLLPLHLCLLIMRHCTLGSSSSLLSLFILFCCLRAGVKLERLRLSRQAVKLEYVRLSDCFSNEPGWATTAGVTLLLTRIQKSTSALMTKKNSHGIFLYQHISDFLLSSSLHRTSSVTEQSHQ